MGPFHSKVFKSWFIKWNSLIIYFKSNGFMNLYKNHITNKTKADQCWEKKKQQQILRDWGSRGNEISIEPFVRELSTLSCASDSENVMRCNVNAEYELCCVLCVYACVWTVMNDNIELHNKNGLQVCMFSIVKLPILFQLLWQQLYNFWQRFYRSGSFSRYFSPCAIQFWNELCVCVRI